MELKMEKKVIAMIKYFNSHFPEVLATRFEGHP